MNHYCPPADQKMIDLEITYSNPVGRMPPERQLYNIQYEGVGFWKKPYTFKLAKIDMDVIRENFQKYKRDLPSFQGRMDLLQYWVDSIWEALYNPCWMRWVRPEDFIDHPNPRKKGHIPILEYQLLHGHHRLRIFDALGANHIWVMMCTGHSHSTDHPMEIRELQSRNTVDPRRGTRSASCVKCGAEALVGSLKKNDFDIRRWYVCPKCGFKDETYQPYPERI